MATITIRPCRIEEIQNAPNIAFLMEEYVSESHNAELPDPDAQWELYKQLEINGSLVAFCALSGDDLVGFMTVITTKMPHHPSPISMTESIFVSKDYRNGGTGLKLIKCAEAHARNSGSNCLIVSAPYGGSLAKVMPRLGYRQSNVSFTKDVRDE